MKRTMNTHSRRKYMAQIPSDELITAQHDLGNNAYKLLMYYYSKGTKWNWCDDNMIKDLGWSKRTLADCRNELIKQEYLYIEPGKHTDLYFIGRQAVNEWKMPDDSQSADSE